MHGLLQRVEREQPHAGANSAGERPGRGMVIEESRQHLLGGLAQPSALDLGPFLELGLAEGDSLEEGAAAESRRGLERGGAGIRRQRLEPPHVHLHRLLVEGERVVARDEHPEEQEPTTLFNIYGSTIETEHDPIFAPIEFEWDMESMRGRFAAPGLMEATFEPIRNPVTDAVHHSSLRLPEGFEFREALLNSGDYWAKTEIPMNGEKKFGYITLACYGPYGVIEEESYPQVRA